MSKLKDASEVVCLFEDTGLFAEIAVDAARVFDHVFYHNPTWKNAFPSSRDVRIGSGFKNVEVIKDVEDIYDEIDFAWFPDVYEGAKQYDLKQRGIPIWGSQQTEWLERKRFKVREWMKRQGMHVAEYKKVIGVDALRDVPPDWHIKIDDYRDDMETFKKMGNATMQEWYDFLNLYLGPWKDDYEFLAEAPIPGIEIGADIWTVLGLLPDEGMFGYEIKGAGYVGTVKKYSDWPFVLIDINDHLLKVFKLEGMTGAFSTEVRVNNKKENFLTDPCMQEGNPPHQSKTVIIENNPEIAWAGANGQLIPPKKIAKYVAQITMTSEFAVKNFLAFDFPEEIRKFVKIKNVAKKNGVYYFVPGKGNTIETVGAVCGIGNTPEVACKHCIENAKKVNAFRLEIDFHALDEAQKTIEEGEKLGIKF